MPATGTSGYHRKRGRQGDETGPGHACGALGTQHRNQQQADLRPEAQLGVGGLCDEQRCQRHVDVGAIEIERIAGRHHQAHHRLAQPARSIFSISEGSADSDDEVPSTSSNSDLR